MSKLVVIIQCEQVQKRCSGYNCTHAFYSREGKFVDYPQDTRYMSFTCGGCCGAGLSVKLENLHKRLRRFQEDGFEVVVHLSTCMVSDNYHKSPCPHLDYIQNLLAKKGFTVVKGTYISKTATKKREAGIYKAF